MEAELVQAGVDRIVRRIRAVANTRRGVIVLLVQKVTVRAKKPLRDKHLEIRSFPSLHPSGAKSHASASLAAPVAAKA
jgi:hypothetical protein